MSTYLGLAGTFPPTVRTYFNTPVDSSTDNTHGNWDVCQHKRSVRSFVPDHLMSLSFVNVGLNKYDVDGLPLLLGINLSCLSVVFDSLSDNGLAECSSTHPCLLSSTRRATTFSLK